MWDSNRRRHPAVASQFRVVSRAERQDVKVDGFAEHVLAVAGYAGSVTAGAQHFVRGWRAVAADDLDRFLGAYPVINLPQQIDRLWGHRGRFVLAPIAHEPVNLLQRRFVVLSVL